jgi:type IV secretion system protein VirB6
MSGFFGSLETQLDSLLIVYTSGVSASATVFLVPIAVTITTIFITWNAYAAARGDLQEPMSKIIKDLTIIVLVGMVALGFGQYQNLVIEGANALLGDLIHLTSRGASRSVGGLLDAIYANCFVPPGQTECKDPGAEMLRLSIKHSSVFGIPDLSYFTAWFFIGLAQVCITLMTLLPFVLSKIALALLLAIGPVFILMLMFPTTRQYFNTWLSAALGNIITLAIVAAISTIVPTLFNQLTADMYRGLFASGSGTESLFKASVNILILAIGLGFTSLKASQMGMQLAGGGVAMDGSGFVGQTVNAITNIWGRRAQNQNNPTGREDSTSPNSASNTNSPSGGGSGSSGPTKASGPNADASRTARASYYSGRVASDIVKALGRKKP